MVRYEQLAVIALIQMLQKNIKLKCEKNPTMECALKVLEEIKIRVSDMTADQMERELFGF